MDIQLNSQILSTSPACTNNFQTTAGSKQGVYAEKGDPIYQKEMDSDEDGVITFEEFKDYCLENDISADEMKQMLKNRLNYQLGNEREKISAEIREIKSDSEVVYAKEGEEDYDKEMDEDGDGKITYEEYMKYCEEHEETKTEKEPEKAVIESSTDNEKVVIKNSGKAVNKYSESENTKTETKIEKEA